MTRRPRYENKNRRRPKPEAILNRPGPASAAEVNARDVSPFHKEPTQPAPEHIGTTNELQRIHRARELRGWL